MWHPIARVDDAPFRHVYQAKLLGREFAVWRADDGYLNVWDNRCLHRGVRLSVGLNEGSELRCLYHGWRYSNRTGGCTYIPAHPADAPARTICNTVFPCIERYGLVWTRDPHTDPTRSEAPTIQVLQGASPFPLRALPFAAPPALVLQHLADYVFQSAAALEADDGDEEQRCVTEVIDSSSIQVTAISGSSVDTLILFVQPVDSDASIVYGVLADSPPERDRLAVLRHHARRLDDMRSHVERIAADLPTPAPMEVALERIEPNLDGPPAPRARQDSELRVVVARKWETANEIAAFELAPLDSTGSTVLPTVQPGSHIDVHLPNGLVRQYSLVNAAGEQERYVIGVKREPDSRGGSACLHDTVREGDTLAISAPRNNFSLRRDAVATTLIAGGIGITPLLSMAETLADNHLPFALHYFVRSPEHTAFGPRLDRLGDGVVLHVGLDPAETGTELESILSSYEDANHVYICGPGPMLDATRATAADAGWPDSAVHFEYFANTTEIDRSTSFEISLARSSLTLDVGAGESILEVLRANGVAMASSCEQGACGTCVVGVISGEPLHQDVYLDSSERAAADRIATCVSRASSERLVLDI
jgi:ferredoxin-NADP reductase/nitrite reductase/ring-hydroxylating ferredoxin subunit